MSVRSTFHVAAIAVLSATTFAVSSPASATTTADQCVYEVIGQDANGTFELSEPTCYQTFAEVLHQQGARSAPDSATPEDSDPYLAAASIIGVHYDGTGGTGASISISGSDCNGGGINVSTDWNDRISSTRNGCGRIAHYSNTNYAGSVQSTYGAGVLSNLNSTLNNATSSIKYFAS